MECFNTQPPEGGWLLPLYCRWSLCRFNTQPPEGGWAAVWGIRLIWQVSTHSRPKAAGNQHCFTLTAIMFQHTAARRRLALLVCHL